MSGAPGPDFDYGGGRDGGGGRGGGGYGEGFRGRGGYGGGGRDRRPGGRGGGGGGQRDGDWPCPNASCGNVNFAKRSECYKCGTAKPGGFSQSGNGSFRSGSNYGANQGGGYGRGSAYPGSGQNDGGGGPPNDYDDAPAGASYGSSRYAEGASGGSYGSTRGHAGRGFDTHGAEKGRGYGGSDYGRGEKGPDYGGADYGRGDKGPGYIAADYGRGDKGPGYVAANYGRGDKAPGYGGADYGRPVNHYSGSDPSFIKQCDEHCGDTCDNSRIYVSGLPLDVTSDELRDLFGGIGQVARIKQKRGYKDQWPWNIKIYTDEAGNNKGDAVLSYEDPSAAHSAGGFFNDYSLRGNRIKVSMAEKYAPRPDQRPGGDRGYGGGSGGGPDRRYGGGYRSRPY